MLAAKRLLLLSALLITACDGGIFGTGGPDDMLITDGVQAGVENPMTGAAPNEQADSGSTSGTEGSDANVTTGDTGSGTDAGSGSTDAGVSDAGLDTDDGGTADGNDSVMQPDANQQTESSQAQFINNVSALFNNAARLNLINTTDRTLNVFETSVEPDLLLFAASGVAPGALNTSAVLVNNNTSLVIIDRNDISTALFTFPEIQASEATLTSLVVAENGSELSVVALRTETETNDPFLAKIRVVQAGTLGNATTTANVMLQSSGANPGGMDVVFKPISYTTPQTDYMEIAAGDYELSDSESRLEAQAIQLVGGSVYTAVIVGNGTNRLVLINDSATAQLIQ